MDGSAGPFVFLLQSAGIVEQDGAEALSAHRVAGRGARRRQVGALRAVRRLQARFHDRFSASGVRLGEPARRHRLRRALVRQGSGARAHVRLHAGRRGDARGRAWALGGSLQNAIVLDEFARAEQPRACATTTSSCKHKVLDAIGDLYLLGHPLIGQYTAFKSGHALNNALARALLARPDALRASRRSRPTTTFRPHSRDWQLSPGLARDCRRPGSSSACCLFLARRRDRRSSALLYLFKRDRRYLQLHRPGRSRFTIVLLVVDHGLLLRSSASSGRSL